jgi:hypothetical protein
MIRDRPGAMPTLARDKDREFLTLYEDSLLTATAADNYSRA